MALLDRYLQDILARPPVAAADVLYMFLHATPRDARDAFARLSSASSVSVI
jgi:hypothetical protein